MPSDRQPHPYAGADVALLTQHCKERVIAPAWRAALAAEVHIAHGIDTDLLGTFTRDVPRVGNQLAAARTKAKLACSQSGHPLGLGSEGSFGPGPFAFGTFDLEVVVLVDVDRGLEVVGRAYEPGLHQHGTVRSIEELADLARRAGFPEHGLVLRPDHEGDKRIRKGLREWAELEAAFGGALAQSATGAVFVENDLRAHQHPSRMAVIQRATADLLERILSLCPTCESPGFGRIRPIRGLPCRDCGAATDETLADEFGCVACPRREPRSRTDAAFAEPFRCGVCNP